MKKVHCWCGMVVDEGRMHYPGGEPEDGPAHKPETEKEMAERECKYYTDLIMKAVEEHGADKARLRELVYDAVFDMVGI